MSIIIYFYRSVYSRYRVQENMRRRRAGLLHLGRQWFHHTLRRCVTDGTVLWTSGRHYYGLARPGQDIQESSGARPSGQVS